MQQLAQALDATVLAPAAVHGDEGDVVRARGKSRQQALVGDVNQVNVLEAGLAKGPLAGAGTLEGNLALVRPASSEKCDPLAGNVIHRHASLPKIVAPRAPNSVL